MPESSDTPPPLHFSPPSSDLDRASTRETTPISTPTGFAIASARKPDRDRIPFSPWQRTSAGKSTASLANGLSTTVAVDFDDPLFPLFPSSPPERTMQQNSSSPINISSSRNASASPPGQQASNLTSALQQAAATDRPDAPASWSLASPNALKANGGTRKDSFGAAMAQYTNGTKPITVVGSNRDKPRRESLAGGLVGGMSWGGVSVGSWIRDE